MTNITFSVDNTLHQRMKLHPEIKWSEILRKSLIQYLDNLEMPNKITAEELRSHLPAEILQSIDNESIEESERYYKKITSAKKHRHANLIELERSHDE
jgi:hypothetical protein